MSIKIFNNLPPASKSIIPQIIISLACVVILLFPLYVHSSNDIEKHVLVLHSYHQGYAWTDNITNGIQSELDASGLNIELHLEYMDTKHYKPEHIIPSFENLLKIKYSDVKFDMIILSDNNALNFMLERGDTLFPETPVVFCGINSFTELLISGHKNITGVVEDIDVQGTLELIMSIMPETEHIAVVNDRTQTGQANKYLLMQSVPVFKDRMDIQLLENISASELKETLGNLDDNTAVILFTFFLDAQGKHFDQDEYLPLVVNSTDVPVFSLWDSTIGQGVMGGIITNGYMQGSIAGRLAIRVLKGEPADAIPVITESPNVPTFDYTQLSRFSIAEKNLPAGSVIINKPFSFYNKYRNLIWTVSGIITFLVLSLIVISINMVHRKRAEEGLRTLNEELDNRVLQRTTELSKAYDQLRDSQKVGRIGSWELDLINNRVTASEELYQIFNVEPEKFNSTLDGFMERIHHDDRQKVENAIKRSVHSKESFRVEFRTSRSDGLEQVIESRGAVRFDNSGNPVFMRGTTQDITERKKSEEEINRIFNISIDLISVIGMDGYIKRLNPSWSKTLGYTENELLDSPFIDFVHPDDHSRTISEVEKLSKGFKTLNFENRYRHKNGQWVWLLWTARPIPEEGLMYCVAKDITYRKSIEKQLEDAAITDELTGLFNRRGFLTLTKQQCKLSDRSKQIISILYLDLDDMKKINDDLGHQEGDRALRDTADILRNSLREADIIARLGGDEFAVLLSDTSEPDADQSAMRHIRSNIKIHNETADRMYKLTLSIGSSRYNPEHPCSIDNLLYAADTSMYKDKQFHKLSREIPNLEDKMIEKRVSTRYSNDNKFRAELDSVSVTINNISTGGVCAATSVPLVVNTVYNINMIPDEEDKICLAGIVVWVFPDGASVEKDKSVQYVLGLKFIKLTDSTSKSLEKYINKLCA